MIEARPDRRISLHTELRVGQTLSSFVGALAALNGLRSAARFCEGFGVNHAALLRGDHMAISALARLAQADVDLLEVAQSLSDKDGYVHVGQRLDRNQLRQRIHVCPGCLADDCANHPALRLPAAAWERGAWRHSWVSTCSTHGLGLVALPMPEDQKYEREELAIQLRDLEHGNRPLPRNDAPSHAVEIYIQERFRGAEQCPVLDALPLADALLLCLYLGAPHQFAQATPRPKNDGERHAWASGGLSIASQGPVAVRLQLSVIGKTLNPHGACEIGLRRVFRSLHDRLEKRTGDDALALRQMLVDIGLEQNLFPFDQSHALGLPLPPRTLQSIESARRQFGISDRILRAILKELEVLPAEAEKQPSNATLVDLMQFEPLLSELKDCLNLRQAAIALGLMPQQMIKLSNASGVLEPFFTRPTVDLKPLRYFRRTQITQFMQRLCDNCSELATAEGLINIWDAGLQTCRQPAEVITAIFDGRIERTFSVGKVRTLRDLLLRVEDARAALIEQASDELINAEDCALSLSVNVTAVRKILQSGLVKAEPTINPVNRRRQLAIRQTDLSQFCQEFISLTAVRKQWGTTAPGMATALTRAGVAPAFPLHQTMVGIYRRRDVEKAKRKLEAVMGEREARYSSVRRSR
jgi:hypothetical protein